MHTLDTKQKLLQHISKYHMLVIMLNIICGILVNHMFKCCTITNYTLVNSVKPTPFFAHE